MFPVLQDTTTDGVWTAYGAVKDDMVLIDLRDGAPGSIVASWMGSDMIAPATTDGRAELTATLDAFLAPP